MLCHLAMEQSYHKIFSGAFSDVGAYLQRDFAEIQTQTNNQGHIQFCLFSCQKTFDVIVDYLIDKVKYSGEIAVQKNLVVDAKNIFSTKDFMQKNKSYKKEKLVLIDDFTAKYNIAYKRNDEQIEKKKQMQQQNEKIKIEIIPIDGLSSFSRGIADFCVVIVVKKEVKNKTDEVANNEINRNGETSERGVFETNSILVYNPVSQNVYTFSKNEGLLLNGVKVSLNNASPKNNIDAIFVNAGWNRTHFDITKVAQNMDFFTTSTSIFNSLCSILLRQNGFVIFANENKEIEEYVFFIIKCCGLSYENVGSHMVIGEKNILAQVIKK